MRFIQKWSYSCANYLMVQMNENHEKRGVYYYGFQILIGALVKGVLLVSMALILRSLLPTLAVVVVFSSLRVLAGGYHMDTYGKCIAISLIMFLAAGFAAQHTYQLWKTIYLIILFAITCILAVIVIIKWAPKDTPNKRITNENDIKKFKKLSLIHISVWSLLVVFLMYMEVNKYIVAACFGMLLEIFTITPFGYNFFDRINGKVSEALK